ncbi:uncharacterized protein [Centruroides vittatus]|uniref:uncharacterized protein isoform X1 n=1 Tax=Centruroides vittatus TaxID=120091 RepID=UPI003510B3A0
MQNTSSSDCVILDGTPNHSSSISVPVFKTAVANNASISSLEEMEIEDISAEVIPNTPSPLLLHNNKCQQIAVNKGLKRTCLEKAFSTMTTSSNHCISEECHSDIQNRENVCPEYNSIKSNFISCPITEIIMNDLKQEQINGKILIPPNENHSIDSSSKQFNNKITRDLDSYDIPSHKTVYPQKRNTLDVYGDSDLSTEDDLYEAEKREKHLSRAKLNLKLKDKKGRRKCKSANEKKRYLSYFDSDSSPNRLNDKPVKERNSNHLSHNNFDLIELPSHSKQIQDISEPSTSSRTLKNKLKSSKFNKCKSTHGISKTCNKQLKDSDSDAIASSCKSNKYERKHNSSKNKSINDNYKNLLISTSNRKFRRIQPRRGNIVKYPVEDSDSEIEFVDAKCDVSDVSDAKRISKVNSRKKTQNEWSSVSECYLDDSCSDMSIISEMHYSPSNQNWRNSDSPDPVEQVRQMEEDEKLAFRLQAQYDAEANLNSMTESEDFDFESSFFSGLHMDNFSNSSDTSSSSTTESGFPFLLPFSPNLHRVSNNSFVYGVERPNDRRRSPRLQQSFIEWIPGRIRNVLSSLMPNFAEDDYETLLQLTENIGDECQGLKKQQVSSLPTRKYFSAQSSKSTASTSETSQECRDCTICLCEYQNNDLLRLLPCSHEFHANCIDRWLKSHRTCPICRVEVTVKRQYGKKRKT